MKRLTLLVLTIFLLGAVACSGAVTSTAEPVAPDAAMADEPMADEVMGDEAMADEPLADEAMAGEPMTDDAMTDEAVAEEPMADEVMADEAMAEEAMADEAMADEAMADDTMTELALWQTLPLTNARTGETFTLGDYAGKTVFVEPMATWCSNCRQQLNNVKEARAGLNSDEVVFIGLSVETNIGAGDLAQYADSLGFDWTFAVMTPEVLQALADDFGRTITNPPSTPHFVISPDGTVSELITGIQSAEEIAALTAN